MAGTPLKWSVGLAGSDLTLAKLEDATLKDAMLDRCVLDQLLGARTDFSGARTHFVPLETRARIVCVRV